MRYGTGYWCVFKKLHNMRVLLIALFSCVALVGHAQSSTSLAVPPTAITQLEDLKEMTKSEVVQGKLAKGAPAEVRPELNRYLVISADDFLRVAMNAPTKEAYLKCLDKGLARIAPFATSPEDRTQVAQYYEELLEIVGLESSGGRLASFTKQPDAQARR